MTQTVRRCNVQSDSLDLDGGHIAVDSSAITSEVVW